MQKIKNMLHHNTDANHNGIPDSQERTGATTTTGRDPILHDHGTNIHNPAVAPMTGSTAPVVVGQHGVVGGLNDRNHNGIPDSQERLTLGQQGFGQTGLVGGLNDRNHNGIPDSQERLAGGVRHNPLDRNHDGRVNLQDLKSTDRNHNGIPDSQERLAGGVRHNPLDRNHDGRVNLQDLKSTDRNHNGIPDSQEGLAGGMRHNPLDRNFDGRVDARDFVGSNTSSTGFLREAPLVREQIQKNVVVHEHIHPVEKEEIQPVIYREREQRQANHSTIARNSNSTHFGSTKRIGSRIQRSSCPKSSTHPRKLGSPLC
eukprot:TRINITY_DN76_c0_g1_i8.p1 TRINITY_DN76_c0_g1~~TRINITY_DN76_c0_g1_i8.p1  ORF type:complete len:314 (-),score=107.87 TRINITY_DN76_c0_g1_i8:1078-2019(-)